jgi:hypothetical protein
VGKFHTHFEVTETNKGSMFWFSSTHNHLLSSIPSSKVQCELGCFTCLRPWELYYTTVEMNVTQRNRGMRSNIGVTVWMSIWKMTNSLRQKVMWLVLQTMSSLSIVCLDRISTHLKKQLYMFSFKTHYLIFIKFLCWS